VETDRRRIVRSALALALLVAGCGTSGSGRLYEWPSYPSSVLAVCSDFQDVDLPVHLAAFAKEIEEIEAEGHRVPPGMHAHLAYLYALAGDMASARRELEEEARLFPESTVFVEGALKRMQR
jgi:hypothetical protein